MSIKAKRICLAIHTYGHIDPSIYTNHISIFSHWGKNFNVVFLSLDGAKVAEARNILVAKAIEMDCSHILFIDSDHIIDNTLLPCLLGNEDVTVVSGLVVKRSGDGPQVGFIKADEDYSYTVQLPLDGMSYDVDACAFGCTLINLDIFKKIEKPWFKDVTLRNREGKLYSRRSDMQFCHDVKKLGGIIKIDTRCIIGHLGKREIFYPKEQNFQINVYTMAAEVIKECGYKSVLDLGCGSTKKLIDIIKPVCSDIMGVDSKDVIDYCKTTDTDIKWFSADLNYDLMLDIKHDVVICADVIEHIKDYGILLETIKRNLSKDGVAIISTPDIDTVSDVIRENSDHVNFWNKADFVKMLEAHGFTISSVELFDEVIKYKSIVVKCTGD